MSRRQQQLLASSKSSGGGGSHTYPWPAESGALHRSGEYLLTENNQAWFGRGLTMFLLYARYLRGEDLSEQLDYSRDVGANYLRVFGPVPVPPWGSEWEFYSKPDLSLLGALPSFFDKLAHHGLRCEFVPICGPWGVNESRAFLQTAYDHASGWWNVLMECTNEPGQPGTYNQDLHALIDGINRYGIVSATGAAWLLSGMRAYSDAHFLDYGTVHTQRDRHYPHDGKECWEWREGGEGAPGQPNIAGSHCAEWDDEPKRIDEVPQNIDEHLSHYATAGIFSSASLVHYDHGKSGLVPPPGGYQDQVVREVAKLWKFIPPHASYGEYARGDWNSFPLFWVPHDSQVNHAYCMWIGSEGWGVNCMPTPGWQPVAKPGYEIVEYGPRPWIFKARR